LGTLTDTLDAAGKVTETRPVPEFNQAILDSLAEKKFHGKISQVPPAVSALKKDGERYYVKAQRGEPIEPPPRETMIYSLKLKKVNASNIELIVRCSSGFYVRSLARDIAKEIGTVGYLDELVRTSVGPFLLDDAIDPNTVQSLDSIRDKIYPVDYPMNIIPRINLDTEPTGKFIHGISVEIEMEPEILSGRRIAVYCKGIFIGVGEIKIENELVELIPLKVIAKPD